MFMALVPSHGLFCSVPLNVHVSFTGTEPDNTEATLNDIGNTSRRSIEN